MSIYNRLPTKDSIRLLRVHRNRDRYIVGELKSVALNAKDRPSYLPVSYVWGDPEHGKPITVNGVTFEVLQSAYAILEIFCDMPELNQTRWIWIDSICMNTDDPDERATQVALMTRIYGGVRGAFIWLGEGTPQSDNGMKLMHAVAHAGERPDEPILKDMQAWKDYQDIALRPWWRRAWTLQESITPQNADSSVVYYCGTKHMTGYEVVCAALTTSELTSKGASLDGKAWEPMWCRRRIYHHYRGENPGHRISLLALLAYTSFNKATEPKDYIYSLLGCINTVDREIVGHPSYSVSDEKVFIDLVKAWVRRRQSLDILSFSQIFRRQPVQLGSRPTLPSWVPDWRDRGLHRSNFSNRTNPLPLLVSQDGKSQIGGLRPAKAWDTPKEAPKYAASGEHAAEVEFSENGLHLACKGIVVDIVDGLSGIADPSDALIQSTSPVNTLNVDEVNTSWSQRDRNTENATAEKSTIQDDVALSLAFGRADVYLQQGATASRFVHEWLALLAEAEFSTERLDKRTRSFVAWFEVNKSLRIRQWTLEEAFRLANFDYQSVSLAPPPKNGVDIVSKFEFATSSSEWARRLCTTEQGHVGMAPQKARKGDVVCVLYGASVPFILRPMHDDCYEFIGESYLHGFMEGEAVGGEYEAKYFNLI